MKNSIFRMFIYFGVIALVFSGCKKDPNTYMLTVNIAPADGGVVEVNPDLSVYEEGTTVTLRVTASEGYSFGSWAGDYTGNAQSVEITMDGDKAIDAMFSMGFNEDFEDDEANNFIDDESGRWSVNDKAYYLTGTGSDTWGYSWYNFTDFDNFEYSVDIKATGNTSLQNAVGIYFRSASGDFLQNSYWFSITFDRNWNFIKFINNETIWLKEWTLSDMINIGLDQTNTLKVRCVGSTIELFVNDISYGVFTDADFSAGYIGVGGYDVAGFNNTYVYDNISLKAIEEIPAKSGLKLTPKVQNITGMDPRFSN